MLKKLLGFVIRLLILGIFSIAFFILLVWIGGFGPIPNKKELTEIKQAQASVVYSTDEQLIGKFFYTNRTNVPYHKLPKHLVQALIATEDVRFYEHQGIDKIAMLRVIVKTLLLGDRSSGGGSTLSQQLAKNLFKRKDFSLLSMPVNKTKEAILANRLESIYSKEEILTLYFNTVPFGERVYGIESAAQRYFSVHVDELSLEQSAILVGMLKANSYYNPRKHPEHAFKRRNVVLKQMQKVNFIADSTYALLSKKPVETHYNNLEIENPNGYFLYQIAQKAALLLENKTKPDGSPWDLQQDGLIVKTTLNAELQTQALKARKAHLIRLQKTMDAAWKRIRKQKKIQSLITQEWQQSNVYQQLKNKGLSNQEIEKIATQKKDRPVFRWEEDKQLLSAKDSIEHYLKTIHAAIYGLNPNTGAVQVYVGGNNFEYLPYNLIKSERQAASTFKPFVYTAALENGEKPCDWINNEEKEYVNYEGWTPKNYDHSNGGYYSMVGALAKSMNIPTVNTYFKIGHSALQNTTKALGLDKTLPNNPSIALGTVTYSLETMVAAYVPFATRGKQISPYYISSIETAEGTVIYQHPKLKHTKVDLNPKSLETMQYLLKNVVDKGTALSLKNRFGAKGSWAGKTGTAQDYSDSWFIGFNNSIVIGSWVGCKYPSITLPSWIGGGSAAALPLVGAVVGHKYQQTSLNKQLNSTFPSFDAAIVEDCDCEFYREENTFEKILDVFDKKKKKKKKGNFFSRLFGKKDKEEEDTKE
ncbi:transglycosylase domain-containing protein [Ochrovirga pacifica]|uniref:transglycosylase domain-containing protein n=1 Tax=Ochrovirga pacifica TaxID=1042376 RepID=UPI0002558E66|nr:transglycosylase domain-containing protein [Ochrovirga pacifica]